MSSSILDRIVFAACIVTSAVALHPAARADQCHQSCGSSHRVCVLQTHTAAKACLQGCRLGAASTQCRLACVKTFHTAQAACRATRADCGTTCPAVAVATDTCTATCSGTAQTCFAGVLSAGQACVQSCPAAASPVGCFEQCAGDLRSSGGACLATLEGCLTGCQGPVSGACFDTIALQCTTETCSPGQACTQPNEFCSARCGTPPSSGTCFDPSTMQCTGLPCSPSQPCAATNQACVPVCPPPTPLGHCFDTATTQCTEQTCVPGSRCPAANQLCTLQCPLPQCSSVPCGGTCVLPIPCPQGAPCPIAVGVCATTPAGSCACVGSPPPPTPTPQCTDGTCGGPCIAAVSPLPCPAGSVCNGPDLPVLAGQCEMNTSGVCECVPVVPTPPPTPTPQCTGGTCGGPCVVVPPCPPGGVCPDVVIQGACRDDASGTCQCMPMSVPTPTPAPPCTTDADCNDGDACTVDHCVSGICEHACICLSAAGAPACCPGPAALCAQPCGADASGACGGTCPSNATCESLPTAAAGCGCVSGVGGPCGGFIVSPPVCAPGLICQQSNPDVTGVCVAPNCIPLFASGCSQTADCCTPCLDGARAPCGVCLNGTCVGAP